jgi:NADPH2:quinone reductase
MRAMTYDRTGAAADVLRLTERPVPEPGPGEVRVRVAVSGVNPTDWKSRAGAAPGQAPPFGVTVPNQDGAGTVDAVGPGGAAGGGLAVGNRVWIWEAAWQRADGTAQEFVVLPARNVVLLPDEVPFEVGASLGIPALTAHRCLTVADGGPTRLARGSHAGRTVLVAGGAGAVGHAAIQLAGWAGATVITTVSSDEKAALARAAGARHVVNYRTSDAAAEIKSIAPDGVDMIVEVAPGPNADLDAAVIGPNGVVAVYANNGADAIRVPIRAHMTPNTRYQFVLVYTEPAESKRNAIADVVAAVADGVLPVGEQAGLPLHRFELARTAEAHEAVEAGVTGKVLVDIG